MLRRYVHLVPAMVTDCLALGVRAETWELVTKPAGWAFREHLSDEHVDQFRRAHELRQAIVDEAKQERRSSGEVRRAPEPSGGESRAPAPYVLLDLLESSLGHRKSLVALERALDALARIPGLQIHGPQHLVLALARAIGESAARRPTDLDPVPGSPDGGPAPSGAPAALGRLRAAAGASVPDDEFDLD